MAAPDDPSVVLALERLRPAIDDLIGALDAAGTDPCVARMAISAIAEAYAVGYCDGQRHAVGQIAPVAARRGLHLKLAPELEEPAATG